MSASETNTPNSRDKTDKDQGDEQLVDSGTENTNSVTLSIDELSPELRQQLPLININSYVVAETANDSFVILDGAFYKVDQVIAPNLILREITNDEIVVDFKSQRIKIPHK